MYLISSCDFRETNDNVLEGVAYHSSGLLFYTSGLKAFESSGGKCKDLQEGRFLIKYKDKDDFVLRTDSEGNELAFYYSSGDFWCVSNSFLGLVAFLEKKSYRLTASRLELAKMFVNTSLFEQAYSNNLPIEEISILDVNEEIRISEGAFKVCSREETTLPETFKENDSFVCRLSNFIQSSRRIIAGLADKFDVDLELSGGVDSRIILGLALPCHDKLNVSSNKMKEKDYIIAKALSRSFGLNINKNRSDNFGRQDIFRKWILYKLANVGVSRTNPLPNGASGTKFSQKARLNGGGGENVKAFYNPDIKAYFNVVDRSILSQELKSEIKKDLDFSLNKQGYSLNPNQAMVRIYSKYRQRFFAGRAWYHALTGIVYAPMASSSYKSLLFAEDIEVFFGLNREEIISRNLIQLLLLYLLNPVLALAQFDEEKKKFPLSDIELIENLIEKNKLDFPTDMSSLSVYGDVESRQVLPYWLEEESDIALKSANSYDVLITNDIEGVIGKIQKLMIIDENELAGLQERLISNSLTKIEKLSLIHISEIMKRASSYS